jgi:C-terminal processing protease CtpA/Prc
MSAPRFTPPNTIVVSTQGRAASQERDYTTSSTAKERPRFPLAVLVNEGSASDAEIVSRALKDLKRAILCRETTFRKGSVQNVLQLPDGSALRFTTAKYYTPGKRSSRQRVTPNIAVPMTAEQEHALFLFAQQRHQNRGRENAGSFATRKCCARLTPSRCNDLRAGKLAEKRGQKIVVIPSENASPARTTDLGVKL